MTYEANPYVEASRTAQRLIAEASPFLATVVSTTGGFVSIRRLGAQAVEGPYPATVGLAAGVSAADLVLVLKAGSTLVVLAKVEGDPASDGSLPTVTGSRGGNAALASLLTALANLGLITDSTSA